MILALVDHGKAMNLKNDLFILLLLAVFMNLTIDCAWL